MFLVNVVVILAGGLLGLAGKLWNAPEIGVVGLSLVSSGIVTLFYFAYPKSNVEEKYSELTRSGLAAAYSSRDLQAEYARLLKDAKKKIDVLGLGLGKFREDNGEIISLKCQEGIATRFLVLEPGSIAHKSRSKEEEDVAGETISIPQDKLLKFVKETNKLIRSGSGGGAPIQLRYYRSTPGIMIFRIDDVMFVGPYLHKKISRHTVTFKLERGDLFAQFAEHFEKLWNDPEFTSSPLAGTS